MFEFCFLPINEKITISLFDNIADKYFIKCLISCFERYNISSYILKDFEDSEDITKFNNNFLCDIKNEDMTQQEYDILRKVLSSIFYSIKDEFEIILNEKEN